MTPKRQVRVNFSDVSPPSAAAPATTRTWSPQQEAVFLWFQTRQVPARSVFGGSPTDQSTSQAQHLVVRARAGTGKTTTIVEGVTRMPERQILLAAFNKEIARELQGRIRDRRVEVKTLHGLGLRYIRRNWNVQVEEDDQRGDRAMTLARASCQALLTPALADLPDPIVRLVSVLHTKVRELEPRAQAAGVADIAARFDMLPSEEWATEGWDLPRVCQAVVGAMTRACERTAVVDYADMIFLPVRMGWVRPWFDAVVVDEAQDMTGVQLEIAGGACRRGGRICLVGDDRQGIYGFRGADVGALDRLKEQLCAAELGLTVTYRCGTSIVALAQQLVPDYQAADGAPAGEIVRCDDEAMLDQAREGDFVISRKNAPLVKVCMSLLKRGVRARVRGRDIGRGIVALIRRLKLSSVADLAAALARHVEREERRAQSLSETARDARVEFVRDQRDVVTALAEDASSIADLEQRVESLFSDDATRGAVLCSTVHKVKGLEADRTFLLEGTFRRGTVEEDNIRYVAITRARTRLCWVSGFGERAGAPS